VAEALASAEAMTQLKEANLSGLRAWLAARFPELSHG